MMETDTACGRMGRSTVATTLDRCTPGINGNEADTAETMQAFTERSRRSARQRAQIGVRLSPDELVSAPLVVGRS
jgi:hypothetical protein